MSLKRFGDKGEAFHLSMLSSYISFCGLATKFTYVYGLVPSHRSYKMWAGTLIHRALYTIHKRNLFDMDEKQLKSLLRDCGRYAEFETDDADIPVRWPDDLEEKEELKEKVYGDFLTILKNYCRDDYNRKSKVLFLEAPFRWEIETPKTTYVIEGKVDKLIERPDGALVLEDYKAGKTPIPSDAQISRDVQLNGYALAMRDGVFYPDTTILSDKMMTVPRGVLLELKIGRLPDFITYHNLRDYLEYQRPTPIDILENRSGNLTTSYKEWFTNVAETYTLDQIRELTGNNRLKATGKVYFNTGHQKGCGRHTIKLSEHSAAIMQKTIQHVCASMRLNVYLPNKAACGTCRHVDTCDIYMEGLDEEYVDKNDFLPREAYQLT